MTWQTMPKTDLLKIWVIYAGITWLLIELFQHYSPSIVYTCYNALQKNDHFYLVLLENVVGYLY